MCERDQKMNIVFVAQCSVFSVQAKARTEYYNKNGIF